MATALFTRWFQTQVFAPDFRTHLLPTSGGLAPHQAQTVLHDYIRLRNRFIPYVHSVGPAPARTPKPLSYAAFLRNGGKMPAYAFGPSLWVCPAPATQKGDWRVVLPDGGRWFDFWTGASFAGGDILRVPCSPDRMPMFVKAGSILPLAALAADGELLPDGHEIRVYPGADGQFIWRDPGSAAITLGWNDAEHTLHFAGSDRFLTCRDLDVVVVRPGRGVGLRSPARPDVPVRYDGRPQSLRTAHPPAKPAAPKGLLIHVQGRLAHARWQEPCAGVLYRLKQAGGPGMRREDIASILATPEHTFEIPEGEEPFHCMVTAMNAGGESAPSAAVPVCALHPHAPRPAPVQTMRRVG